MICVKKQASHIKLEYARMFESHDVRKNFNNPHILCLKTIGLLHIYYIVHKLPDVNYCFSC